MHILVKTGFLWLLLSTMVFSDTLDQKCLSCHQKQQIPTELIYKRYLTKYSTNERISRAIYRYLQNPTKKSSIMPLQFFLKFPMKKPLQMTPDELHEMVKKFVQRFDLRQKLRLER